MKSIKTKNRPSSREDMHMIAGHFTADTVLAWRELVVRVGRTKGRLITSRDALGEAMHDYFKKHGMRPPPELTHG